MSKTLHSLVACFLQITLVSVTNAEGYIPPSFIPGSDKTFSAYPASEVSMARTARVWVSYMVGKDGNVFEPMIEQINNDRFTNQILKWMQDREYQPATLDDEPVEAWVRDRFSFNIGYGTRSPRVSTKLFNKYYKSFGIEMQNPEPDQKKVQKWLKKMAGAKHGSPLAYEFLSAARYQHAARFLDREAQILALREMILSSDKGMALANGINADQELIRLLIEAGYYGEAQAAYYLALRKHGNDVDMVLKQAFEPTIQQINDILETDKAFARLVKIGDTGYTFVPVSKRVLAFDELSGVINTLKFRCEKKFAELPLTIDSEYQIPASWGDCQMQILGEPGASAKLIQF